MGISQVHRKVVIAFQQLVYPAHQIVNDSDAELAYLSISTMLPAEVCEYPDSKKIGAFGGGLRHMTHPDHAVDYWKDEA